jgi:hypothetical protein
MHYAKMKQFVRWLVGDDELYNKQDGFSRAAVEARKAEIVAQLEKFGIDASILGPEEVFIPRGT